MRADGNLDAVPQITPDLEGLPQLEDDFIDYVIEESFSQIARLSVSSPAY